MTKRVINSSNRNRNITLSEFIFMYTSRGAKDVLKSCVGWFTLSQSNTTRLSPLANSNIRSISSWTSAVKILIKYNTKVEEAVSTFQSRSHFVLIQITISNLKQNLEHTKQFDAKIVNDTLLVKFKYSNQHSFKSTGSVLFKSSKNKDEMKSKLCL